jgi:hypothetical protein
LNISVTGRVVIPKLQFPSIYPSERVFERQRKEAQEFAIWVLAQTLLVTGFNLQNLVAKQNVVAARYLGLPIEQQNGLIMAPEMISAEVEELFLNAYHWTPEEVLAVKCFRDLFHKLPKYYQLACDRAKNCDGLQGQLRELLSGGKVDNLALHSTGAQLGLGVLDSWGITSACDNPVETVMKNLKLSGLQRILLLRPNIAHDAFEKEFTILREALARLEIPVYCFYNKFDEALWLARVYDKLYVKSQSSEAHTPLTRAGIVGLSVSKPGDVDGFKVVNICDGQFGHNSMMQNPEVLLQMIMRLKQYELNIGRLVEV